MIEEALLTHLSTDAVFAPLLGGTGDACRLYPRRLPQGPVYPSATYFLVDAPRRAYTHDNAGNPPAGTVLVRARVQIDLWAAKDTDGAYESLLPIEAALIASISGFRGTMGGTLAVQSCFIDNAGDKFETDTSANRRTVDAVLTFEEG